jgi:hypothetical protein
MRHLQKEAAAKMTLLFAFIISLKTMAFDHSHSDFQNLLSQSVKKNKRQNLINYKAIKSSPKLLDQYLDKLSSVSLLQYNKWNDSQKLSFLINSYNAFTIKLIVENYPVKTIKTIGPFYSSPWKKRFFNLLNQPRSLDWIEHDKIRKDFSEPRIHFAVVCASISCPNIQPIAYTSENLNALLDSAANSFLNDKDKNYIKDDIIYLSKIFKWYGEDFGNLQSFLSKYMGQKIPKEIEWLSYDWGLNEWQ